MLYDRDNGGKTLVIVINVNTASLSIMTVRADIRWYLLIVLMPMMRARLYLYARPMGWWGRATCRTSCHALQLMKHRYISLHYLSPLLLLAAVLAAAVNKLPPLSVFNISSHVIIIKVLFFSSLNYVACYGTTLAMVKLHSFLFTLIYLSCDAFHYFRHHLHDASFLARHFISCQ